MGVRIIKFRQGWNRWRNPHFILSIVTLIGVILILSDLIVIRVGYTSNGILGFFGLILLVIAFAFKSALLTEKKRKRARKARST